MARNLINSAAYATGDDHNGIPSFPSISLQRAKNHWEVILDCENFLRASARDITFITASFVAGENLSSFAGDDHIEVVDNAGFADPIEKI